MNIGTRTFGAHRRMITHSQLHVQDCWLHKDDSQDLNPMEWEAKYMPVPVLPSRICLTHLAFFVSGFSL